MPLDVRLINFVASKTFFQRREWHGNALN